MHVTIVCISCQTVTSLVANHTFIGLGQYNHLLAIVILNKKESSLLSEEGKMFAVFTRKFKIGNEETKFQRTVFKHPSDIVTNSTTPYHVYSTNRSNILTL